MFEFTPALAERFPEAAALANVVAAEEAASTHRVADTIGSRATGVLSEFYRWQDAAAGRNRWAGFGPCEANPLLARQHAALARSQAASMPELETAPVSCRVVRECWSEIARLWDELADARACDEDEGSARLVGCGWTLVANWGYSADLRHARVTRHQPLADYRLVHEFQRLRTNRDADERDEHEPRGDDR